jgi:hypothetical protein
MGYVYQVSCTGCNHKSSLSIGPKRYFLKEKGVVDENIQSQFAVKYCRSCDKITSVFMGKAAESWELQYAKDNYSRLQKEYENTSGLNFIKKRSLKKQLEDTSIKISELTKAGLANEMFWDNRVVKPRCMTCGSTNIDVSNIELPSSYTKGISTSVAHSCGGKLVMKQTMHFSPATVLHIFYDAEGNKLSEVERPFER